MSETIEIPSAAELRDIMRQKLTAAQARVAELERFVRMVIDNHNPDQNPSQWVTVRFHKMVIDNMRKALNQ